MPETLGLGAKSEGLGLPDVGPSRGSSAAGAVGAEAGWGWRGAANAAHSVPSAAHELGGGMW